MSELDRPDCLIVGGGVIGLSLAWELAQQSLRVTVLDQGEIGREASWAGAGILPPANRAAALHPYDELRGLSLELHEVWAQLLRERTGIDTGYRRCGGLYLSRTAGETAALAGWVSELAVEQIPVERLTPKELAELEPEFAAAAEQFRGIYHLPGERQLRNPRHLSALRAICELSGVRLVPNTEVTEIRVAGDRISGVQTTAGSLEAGAYCLTAGAWTGRIAARRGMPIEILPMRGQILMFRCESPLFSRVVNEGSRYLVPRDDGRVLVGSTEEEVGFDKRNTEEALEELREMAFALAPSLRSAKIERSWAGFRPATFDGFPYLGALPGLSNGYVAAGHFRSGIWLSPATAVVMRQLICGQKPEIDLRPFRVGR